MTVTAMLFLLLSVALVWGGLAVSIARLVRDTSADADLDPHEMDPDRPVGH